MLRVCFCQNILIIFLDKQISACIIIINVSNFLIWVDMFTIKDLAKECGYTVATVSRAMNDSPLVADKTKEKIREIAKQHGYVPNILAKNLVTQRSSCICMIVPDIVNPYFPMIVKAVQDEASNYGMFVIVCNSDWKASNEFSLVKLMYAQRVAGMIMDPSSDESYKNIRKSNINVPIVFVGSRTEDDDVSSVLVDNRTAMYTGVDYLHSLGHEKIALIGGKENTYVNRKRIKGFFDAMKAHGHSPESICHIRCQYKESDGYIAAKELISTGNMPTAIVAINDIVAFGIISFLKDNKIRVPEDVSVIGFDDIESSNYAGLTTIREPRYQMGQAAAKILFEMIKNHDSENTANSQHILFKPELIIRDTCSDLNLPK